MSYNFTYLKFAEALYYSLCQNVFYTTLVSSIEGTNSQKEAMIKYMDFSMTEAQNFGMLHIPNDHEFGVSVWLKPLSNELENRRKKEGDLKQARIFKRYSKYAKQGDRAKI